MQTSVPPPGGAVTENDLGEAGDQRQPEAGAGAVHARRHAAALVAHGHPQLVAVHSTLTVKAPGRPLSR